MGVTSHSTCGDTSSLPSSHLYSLVLIDLGSAVPTAVGYDLSVDTCLTSPGVDTILFVGSGCPDSWADFSCVAGDDIYAGCGGAAASALLSRVRDQATTL